MYPSICPHHHTTARGPVRRPVRAHRRRGHVHADPRVRADGDCVSDPAVERERRQRDGLPRKVREFPWFLHRFVSCCVFFCSGAVCGWVAGRGLRGAVFGVVFLRAMQGEEVVPAAAEAGRPARGGRPRFRHALVSCAERIRPRICTRIHPRTDGHPQIDTVTIFRMCSVTQEEQVRAQLVPASAAVHGVRAALLHDGSPQRLAEIRRVVCLSDMIISHLPRHLVIGLRCRAEWRAMRGSGLN